MCPVHVSDNLMSLRWGKLLMNAVMSGMSTAIGGSFGDVLDSNWATTCSVRWPGVHTGCCRKWSGDGQWRVRLPQNICIR